MSPEQVWQEFCAKLASGDFSPDDCRPLAGNLGGFLTGCQAKEFRAFLAAQPVPSWTQADDKLIFEVPTGEDTTLRLDFLLAEDHWYFFHLESITLPVKEIPSLPFSDCPGLPRWENWMREEIAVSEKIRLLVRLAGEKGFDEALEWFRDGAGYRLGAISWVPYFPEPQAFVIYACWTEKHLHGRDVSLEEFSDDRCVIVFRNHLYLELYDRAGHLRPQISEPHYRRFFESVWQDRARHAGWEVSFGYEGYDVTLTLIRQPEAMGVPR
jgi:hypothetical protein